MNPKPFFVSNHLTEPVGMTVLPQIERPCTRDMKQILPVLKLPYVSRQNTLANRLNQQIS
jgi:hypothetical protein